jgi:hypothetical protein
MRARADSICSKYKQNADKWAEAPMAGLMTLRLCAPAMWLVPELTQPLWCLSLQARVGKFVDLHKSFSGAPIQKRLQG